MSDGGVAGRAYAALTRLLLPADFRARHGDEMARVFQQLWRARTGGGGGFRIGAAAVWDVVRAAWGAHAREWSARAAVRRRQRDPAMEGNAMENVAQDIKYSARQLGRRPAFTAVLVVTLALGIGANTAVFSVVDGVLLRPLPYPQPDRLAVVWTQFPTMNLMEFPASWPEYEDYAAENRSFEQLALWGPTQRTITGGDNPERLDVAFATWTLFPVLGVEPLHGRAFGPEEDVAGSDDVVVLSHGLWDRRFGSDPSIVGRTVELDGRTTQVLGVMPEGFAFPDRDTQAWIPAGIDPANPPGRGSHFGNLVGRLNAGVTIDQASTELRGLMERWAQDQSLHMWKTGEGAHTAFIRSLHEQIVGDVRTSLLVMLGAVALVLLIACANVANLLLVRGEARVREISIRAAMGAGRGRIVRQLVTESLLLALVGGVAGLILARIGLSGLLALAPADLPRTDSIGLDGNVLLFSAGVAIFAGLLFGLAPAFQTARTDVQSSLRDEGRGGTAGVGRFRYRQLLVVSQTTLAVVLLIGAGLLIQSFRRLSAVDPGFRAAGILSVNLSLPATTYPEPGDVVGFYRDLLPRLASVPGVVAAGGVRQPPLTGALPPNDITFENRPAREDDPPLNADIQVVSPGYFETLGIPVIDGRDFQATDDAEAPLVAIVDEEFVQMFYPDRTTVLGERVQQSGFEEFATIVGVVGNVRQERLDREPRGQLYFTHAQSPRTWFPVRAMTVLLRTRVDPLDVAPTVRGEVRAMDANLPVYDVTTVERTVDEATAAQRFTMSLQMVFAAVALSLAMIGIYGVLSYSVAQRTREIGIRMALGAERRSILKLVVGQGMALVIAAVVLGVLGALAFGRVLTTLLYGISPRDPVTFLTVAGALTAIALVACWIPARRASGVSPQSALRFE